MTVLKTKTGLRMNIEAHNISVAVYGPCPKSMNCSICNGGA